VNVKRRRCLSALTPHAFAAQVSLGLLTAFHVALLVLWARGTFAHHLFSLKRIGFVTQFLAITTQLFSVLILALLCFVVQAIASDRIVRRRTFILDPNALTMLTQYALLQSKLWQVSIRIP
jgi:hypothetical protein